MCLVPPWEQVYCITKSVVTTCNCYYCHTQPVMHLSQSKSSHQGPLIWRNSLLPKQRRALAMDREKIQYKRRPVGKRKFEIRGPTVRWCANQRATDRGEDGRQTQEGPLIIPSIAVNIYYSSLWTKERVCEVHREIQQKDVEMKVVVLLTRWSIAELTTCGLREKKESP
jgi:hypothetical protein